MIWADYTDTKSQQLTISSWEAAIEAFSGVQPSTDVNIGYRSEFEVIDKAIAQWQLWESKREHRRWMSKHQHRISLKQKPKSRRR